MKQKYLLFYLKTGGGHLAPARSIARYIENKYTENKTPVLIDGFAKTNRVVKAVVEDGYRKSQAHATWIFEALYAISKIPFVARFHAFIISFFVKPYLKEIILKEKPAKIAIFHFFLIKPILDILEENNLDIPAVTVVTDPYTAHPIWFLRKDQKYIVFSKELKEYTMQKNIPAEKIQVFPFIVDEKFSQPINKDKIPQLKGQYGFNKDKKLVLIMGGGDGMPRGKKILENILKSNSNADIAIVCGKNKHLYNNALKLKQSNPDRYVKVYGFIDFVYELLNISDIVITKCGASTFMEILMTNKIPIVNKYIWEQEKGNMEFIRDNQMGVYEKNPKKLAEIIDNIITNNKIYSTFNENIQKAKLRNGTEQVANFILDFS